MENTRKQLGFPFWLIRSATKWWVWALVIIATSMLIGTDIAILGGLGAGIYGMLAFFGGINLVLDNLLGHDYTEKDLLDHIKTTKEKTNDATH